MPLLSYVYQLFNANQYPAYMYTLRWQDRGTACHPRAAILSPLDMQRSLATIFREV